MISSYESPSIPPHKEEVSIRILTIRDMILGWRDGVVNALGLKLGIASVTSNVRFIMISVFAAVFAETHGIALRLTPHQDAHDFYLKQLRKEMHEVETMKIEELRPFPEQLKIYVKALLVGLSAITCSLIP